MNTRTAHFLSAMLMLSICNAVVGQNGPPTPEEEWPVVNTGCRVSNFPSPGLSLYVDKEDAFQFKYPSALKTEDSSLQFENWTCVDFFHSGEGVRLEVSLPSSLQGPVWGHGENVVVEKRAFNQLDWVNYTDTRSGSASYCTYWKHEQVCIFGADTSREHRLSENLMRTMREIESTFVFTDISGRLDNRIAAVKVGQRFGNLRVRRVITSETTGRIPKEFEDYEPYGEIDFSGYIRLTGYLENRHTMNSGPYWSFDPDTKSNFLLSCALDKNLQFQVEFNNGGFVGQQIDRLGSQEYGSVEEKVVTVVVKNVSVFFLPMGGPSSVSADLVSIIENH
jgi:hypothetical protein